MPENVHARSAGPLQVLGAHDVVPVEHARAAAGAGQHGRPALPDERTCACWLHFNPGELLWGTRGQRLDAARAPRAGRRAHLTSIDRCPTWNGERDV